MHPIEKYYEKKSPKVYSEAKFTIYSDTDTM